MKETVHFTDRQRAIIGAIIKQYEEKPAFALVKYDPIKAHSYFVETGDFVKYKLDVPTQFEVLAELSAMDLGIEIYITKDDFDPEKRCVTDALGNKMYLRDDSDELEQAVFDIRYHFGSVRIIIESIDDIARLKDMCEEGYRARLEIVGGVSYRVKCYCGKDSIGVYQLPSLHDGKRPQLILKYAIDHKVEGEPISKENLNKYLSTKPGALEIKEGESIASSIFDGNTVEVLSYFFDFRSNSIYFNGYVREGLTKADINVFEKCNDKQ